ncbi:MAG: radical SAM protein [Azospirillaceae bacterium]|nr:radical SAM protein [Azospirillaceae bacterium]
MLTPPEPLSGLAPPGLPAADMPDPRTTMTLTELADFQAIAGHHITFSLTLACPLRCTHCIVSASPDLKHTTMPVAVAQAYADQMPALAAAGIRSLSFTGGEPFLAREQVKLLTESAAANGIKSGVVTAGHWGKSPTLARRLVEEFRGITNWDISIDSYHLDWIELGTVVNAIEAARDAGRRVTVRYSYNDPPTDADRDIWAAIHDIAGVEIASQRVRTEGRARDLALEAPHRYSPWVKPCLTQGMVVRYDGSIAPCCLNLVEAREHPFQFGDARTRPLADLHRDFLSHPLLQLIRVLGFSEVWTWLRDDGLDALVPEELPDDSCDLCSLLMRKPAVAAYLAERAARPEVEARIALLASRVLGEHTMALHLVRRWREAPDSRPPGFADFDDYVAAVAGEEVGHARAN